MLLSDLFSDVGARQVLREFPSSRPRFRASPVTRESPTCPSYLSQPLLGLLYPSCSVHFLKDTWEARGVWNLPGSAALLLGLGLL